MSSNTIDFIVYCAPDEEVRRGRRRSYRRIGRGRRRALRERDVMVEFIAKTWFLWWAVAAVIIIRWFSVVAVDTELEIPDSPPHSEAGSDVVSGGLTSRA